MISHYLHNEEHASQKTKQIIKKRYLNKLTYEPFHMSCQYTHKKVCHCQKNTIDSLSQKQREKLGEQYCQVYNFYENVSESEMKNAEEMVSIS